MTSPKRDTSQSIAPTALHHIALVVLLALIPLRTVINETHTFEVPRLFRAMQTGGPQPATTLVFSIVILVVAGAVLYDALKTGKKLLRTGAELGAILLLIAAIISTWRAGQKHLAFIGVIDFLSIVVYFLTLRQLLRSNWQIRLALFVVVGTGAAVAFKCGWQKYVELPETIEYFEKNQAELTKSDPKHQTGFEYDFEMRLRSGAVTAFYAHPNPLASQLILFVMATLALIAERRKNAAPFGSLVIPSILIVALSFALWSTQSKGAVAACAIAIGIWLATLVLRRMVSTRSRATVFAGWIIVLVAATAVIGLLRAKPDALGRSILFRYMYWQGACDMIADQGVLGVGANNFGRHFTRYKSVECPEEVESPHSWPMQFASEWGLLGLAGFLLLALGTSLRAADAAPGELPAHSEPDRTGPGPVVPEPVIAPLKNAGSARATLFATTQNRANAETLNYATKPQTSASGAHSIILWIAAVFLAAFVPWIATLGESNVVFVALHVGVAALPWFVGMALVSLQSMKSPGIPETPVFAMAAAIAAGLVGFLIHTSIDLALFSGGPATTFFALAAILLAVRESRSAEGDSDTEHATPNHRAAIAAALVGLVLIVAIATQLARPAATLADSLITARSDNRPSPWDVYNASAAGLAYHEGHAAYPLDATAGIELIEQLMRRVQSLAHSEALLQLAEECRRRDPNNSLVTAHLSGIYRQRYEITHDPADFQKSIELYRVCIAQYPTAPMRHIHFANLLEEYANATHDTSPLREAAAALRIALDLESKRIYVSLPNRMKQQDADTLRQRIAALNQQ